MIAVIGDPVLHKIAAPVEHGSDCTQQIELLTRELDLATGVGIAANQVGLLDRIVIIRTDDLVSVVINPQFTVHKASKRKTSIEGCLSIPNQTVKCNRHNRITLTGFDSKWNPISKQCRGFTAFVVQHEIDHLDGILIK